MEANVSKKSFVFSNKLSCGKTFPTNVRGVTPVAAPHYPPSISSADVCWRQRCLLILFVYFSPPLPFFFSS